jgi:glycosyltransferase involved in cell wall biosynthesis
LAAKIRVLFAIGEMSGGGSQRQLIGILRTLDRQRFMPHLYLVSPGGELLPEVPADVPVHIFAEGYRQPLLSYPGQAHAACVRDLTRVLRDSQIDLVYDRTYHMTMIAAPAARRAGAARLSVVVADPQRDFETNVERFRAVKRYLLRRAYRSADRVLAVSEGIRTAAERYYGLPEGKAITIYNSYDLERVDRLMGEPLPPEEKKAADRFEIVAAGRLHPQKGFAYLLEAIRELVHERGRSHIHLRILGQGELEPQLKAFVAKHTLSAHVTFAGFRKNPLPYFRQADLFCLSSLYEGMPNALVEAMLCSAPVLATDCPSGPREVLQGGRLGRLVPPADARALADAIDDAVRHPEQWRARVAEARDSIRRAFALEVCVRQLEELMLAIVWQRRGSRENG